MQATCQRDCAAFGEVQLHRHSSLDMGHQVSREWAGAGSWTGSWQGSQWWAGSEVSRAGTKLAVTRQEHREAGQVATGMGKGVEQDTGYTGGSEVHR